MYLNLEKKNLNLLSIFLIIQAERFNDVFKASIIKFAILEVVVTTRRNKLNNIRKTTSLRISLCNLTMARTGIAYL